MQYYYYACEDDDGTPGLEDPDGFYPILCADEFVEGAPCGPEEAPFDNVGCCTLEGVLYFCDTGNSDTVIREDCAA